MYANLLKDSNFSVLILCPTCNIAGLRYTVTSLKNDFPGVSYLAMVGRSVHNDDLNEMNKCCRIHKAGKTITSLIDVGLRLSNREWVVIMMAGARFRYKVFKKYCYFTECNKDILFPVVNSKYLFDEGSINGIVVNRNVIHEVGEFGDNNENLQESKLRWAGIAIDKGYRFKAIVGGRLV